MVFIFCNYIKFLIIISKVCTERVAYYSNGAMQRKLGDSIPCAITSFLTGRVENLAFALTKNNPFTQFISYK